LSQALTRKRALIRLKPIATGERTFGTKRDRSAVMPAFGMHARRSGGQASVQ
jgi:hypothetical protein